jgi:Calx-beta domain
MTTRSLIAATALALVAFVVGPTPMAQAATPTVSIGDVSVVEGQSTRRYVKFTVTLSEPAGSTITVPYSTADTSASNGPDYKAKSGTLTYSAGQTTKYFAVLVWPDSMIEGDETFAANLGTPTGATLADANGVGTIIDDDPSAGPKLSIGDARLHQACAGTAKPRAVVVVTLSARQGSPVVVNVASSDASATSASDYTPYNKNITFSADQNLKEVKVPISNDAIVEGTESFLLSVTLLSGPVTLGKSTATVTIEDCTP